MIRDLTYPRKIPISNNDQYSHHLKVTKPEDSKAVNGEEFQWICIKHCAPDTRISKRSRRNHKHWDNILSNIPFQLKEKIEPKEELKITNDYEFVKEERKIIKRVAFEHGLGELSSPNLKENG